MPILAGTKANSAPGVPAAISHGDSASTMSRYYSSTPVVAVPLARPLLRETFVPLPTTTLRS